VTKLAPYGTQDNNLASLQETSLHLGLIYVCVPRYASVCFGMLYTTFYNIKPSVVKCVTSPVKKCLKLFDLTAEVVYRQALLQNGSDGRWD
jgi:hypothetical protein